MNIIVRPTYQDIFPNQLETIEEVLTNSNSDVLFDFISSIIHDYDKKFDTERKHFDFAFNFLLRSCDSKIVEEIKLQTLSIKKRKRTYIFLINIHAFRYLSIQLVYLKKHNL